MRETPASAGITARKNAMKRPRKRFLAFNAVGGLVWGAGFVLLGYLAGNSYEAVAKTVGTDVAAAVLLITVAALVVWRVRVARRKS